jgi:hypothetical protein
MTIELLLTDMTPTSPSIISLLTPMST